MTAIGAPQAGGPHQNPRSLALGHTAHEGHRTTARLRVSLLSGLPSIPAVDHAQEHGQDSADQLPIPGQAVANLERQTQHPLAHRHLGEHLVRQARSSCSTYAGS